MAVFRMQITVVLFLLQMLSGFSMTIASHVKGGYWPGWIYIPDVHFNVSFQTHVLYAFAGINSSYACVAPSDDYAQYKTFSATALKSNPNIQTLVSIGGGNSNATVFAEMVSTLANRKVFIDTSIAFAKQYNFSGLDLDWEFPASQEEMNNQATFFEEWYAATVAESKTSGKTKLLLTVQAQSPLRLSTRRVNRLAVTLHGICTMMTVIGPWLKQLPMLGCKPRTTWLRGDLNV